MIIKNQKAKNSKKKLLYNWQYLDLDQADQSDQTDQNKTASTLDLVGLFLDGKNNFVFCKPIF